MLLETNITDWSVVETTIKMTDIFKIFFFGMYINFYTTEI